MKFLETNLNRLYYFGQEMWKIINMTSIHNKDPVGFVRSIYYDTNFLSATIWKQLDRNILSFLFT